MNVKVDPDLCAASAFCAELCPEVFEIADGVSQVKVAKVPAELEEKVRQAVEACPLSAISIEE